MLPRHCRRAVVAALFSRRRCHCLSPCCCGRAVVAAPLWPRHFCLVFVADPSRCWRCTVGAAPLLPRGRAVVATPLSPRHHRRPSPRRCSVPLSLRRRFNRADALLSLRCCRCAVVAAPLSLRRCRRELVAAPLSVPVIAPLSPCRRRCAIVVASPTRRCRCAVKIQLSPRCCRRAVVAALLSLRCCPRAVVAAPLSPCHCCHDACVAPLSPHHRRCCLCSEKKSNVQFAICTGSELAHLMRSRRR